MLSMLRSCDCGSMQNGKSYTKFQSLETIEKLIPELKKMMLDMTEKTVKKKTENS
jgi:hypothetical protein